MAKILIFTAKWPFSNNEIDGGSVTVKQYIDILSKHHQVDYLYLQKRKDEVLENLDGLTNCEIVDGSYLDYYTYNGQSENKFEIRLKNIDYNNLLIKDRIDKYDLVIIVHCLQAMGLEKVLNCKDLKKIVVLPMFLSNSYLSCGEAVSQKYIDAERSVLSKVGAIITPSKIERDYIVSKLKVQDTKIYIIPRGVGREFVGEQHFLRKENINICYVGSFKTQKNNFESIIIAHELIKINPKINFYLVGTIQDKQLYNRCKNYILDNNLSSNVYIPDIMRQEELAIFYKNMDIAISTSKCETFGRGIFEGLAMGLPTVCFNFLNEVKGLSCGDKGIFFVNDGNEMIKEVLRILEENYHESSLEALKLGRKFSYKKQEASVVETIGALLIHN